MRTQLCLLDVIILRWRQIWAPALDHLRVTKVYIRGNYTAQGHRKRWMGCLFRFTWTVRVSTDWKLRTRNCKQGYFYARLSFSPFQLLCDWRFKWEIPWCLDWKGWTNTLATSKPRSLSTSFFLWGYIKNIVYAEKIRNIQSLQDRITSASETVTGDMIQKTSQEIEFSLDVSRSTNGAHIEMY